MTTRDAAPAPDDTSQGNLRLDKWLWFARFVKSRSLASKLVESAHMRVNGMPTTKAHYAVKVDDVLTFALGPHIRVIKVVALGIRRGPAPEAQSLYSDLDPPLPSIRTVTAIHEPGQREAGSGRPTKRDRREIDRLQHDE